MVAGRWRHGLLACARCGVALTVVVTPLGEAVAVHPLPFSMLSGPECPLETREKNLKISPENLP